MYEIALTGSGSAGTPYLTALKAFSTPTGLIPEQVWNVSAKIAGDWQTTTPAAYAPGSPTKSMAPLSWAMGEYISLTAAIHNGRVVDIVPEVCARYRACAVPAASGQSVTTIRRRSSPSMGSRCT